MFKLRNRTDYFIIHRTNREDDEGVAEIKRRQRAQGYLDIGFHFVVRQDGTVEHGRARDAVGLHAGVHNRSSIGICVVGIQATAEQMAALGGLVAGLLALYPEARVVGHSDLNPKTACPGFDVKLWWESVVNRMQTDVRTPDPSGDPGP